MSDDPGSFCTPGLSKGCGLVHPDCTKGTNLRIFVEDSVPPTQRVLARETVAAMLGPLLKSHPQYATLAVMVSREARRGGWQVTVLALDPQLSLTGTDVHVAVDARTLDGIREALDRL